MTPGDYGVEVRAKGFAPDFCNTVRIVEGQSIALAPRPLIPGATISASCGATA